MHLRYALLALLSEGEAHGYQLLKLFNQRLGPFWHPNIGQVYQLLHDLERRRHRSATRSSSACSPSSAMVRGLCSTSSRARR